MFPIITGIGAAVGWFRGIFISRGIIVLLPPGISLTMCSGGRSAGEESW